MPATTLITTQQFSLIGLPSRPAIVDARIDDDYRAVPTLVPGSLRRDYRFFTSWAKDYVERAWSLRTAWVTRGLRSAASPAPGSSGASSILTACFSSYSRRNSRPSPNDSILPRWRHGWPLDQSR